VRAFSNSEFKKTLPPINSSSNMKKCGKGYPNELFRGGGGKGAPDKGRTWPPPGPLKNLLGYPFPSAIPNSELLEGLLPSGGKNMIYYKLELVC
jgi:hypothetical protein